MTAEMLHYCTKLRLLLKSNKGTKCEVLMASYLGILSHVISRYLSTTYDIQFPYMDI